MRLIVGGRFQGKHRYLSSLVQEDSILNGAECPLDLPATVPAMEGLHHYVRRCAEQGVEPVKRVLDLVLRNPDIILSCDEVGCGVVPMEAFQRQWRDQVGSLCQTLAREAEHVDYLICGIVQRLK